MTITTADTTRKKDGRLDLDAIDERMEAEIEREREEASAIINGGKQSDQDTALTVQVEQSELTRLREENEKMKAAVGRFLEARNRAREFITIWSDPRKLPELVQEVYMSHPDIQTLKKKMGDEPAQRAARLVAHMALTYEIHPLITGMIYAWEQDGKVLVEVGYRGYGEMLKRSVMDFETRAMTEGERKEHGLEEGDRGWLCFVHDWARVERFTKHGRPAPEPYRGVGVWRQKNLRGKPDNIPASKSNDWVAEKNAIKSAARFALSFAVTKTAQADAIDFVYSANDDAWVMPVEIADWLKVSQIKARFRQLLAEAHITGEAFNEFLGHNWEYTQLGPDEIEAKRKEFIAQRDQMITDAFTETPVENAESAQDQAKPEPDPPTGPCHECGQITSGKQADTGEWWCLDCAKAADNSETKTTKQRKSKTRRQPKHAQSEDAAPKCANCEIEEATGDEDSPYPDLCKTCADNKANAEAEAKS